MMPEMTAILDTKFKDDSPKNTVERIKGILQTYGIETVENWGESGVPSCYSLRLSVTGTAFGVNGKGITEELALASAYGELMERLQLGRLFKGDQQKDGSFKWDASHDGYATVDELLQRNKKWYTLLAEKAKKQTGTVITEEEILKRYCNKDGKIPLTSFYCVNKKSMEYLPSVLSGALYGTNGCAAGNTPEEAIVQAISEIVERCFSDRILWEGAAAPNISEEVLKSCKTSYEIITYLRDQNFRVVVKDCSLGTKFPAVCVCLIEQKTGKYHTHFGAYPKFEIALQRTLTETFQGRNLQTIAAFSDFAKQKSEKIDVGNMLDQFVFGTSEKSPDFFVGNAELSDATCGFSGTNNRELLKECIDFITEQGYDILIRDYSCLGFPTYQVIIPGFSEAFAYRVVPGNNDSRYNKHKRTVLRNPAKATLEEIMGFYVELNQSAKQKLGAKPFSKQANLPLQISIAEERYLMIATIAYLNYALGRQKETISLIDKMLAESVEKNEEQLICIKRYLTLSNEYQDQDKVRMILEYFHTPETITWLYSAIAEKKNLLDPFVLHCDLQCTPTCSLSGVCVKKQTDALSKLIKDKWNQLDRTVLAEHLDKLLQ